MKKYTRTDELAQIISKLPLKEKVSFANMKKQDVDTLQHVFDLYIRGKADHDDGDYANIMNKLWEHLQETHRLRLVK
jgi:hypothetical protein